MEQIETWKDVPGCINYQVSNLGRVKSLKFSKERVLKSSLREGYPRVVMCENGKQKHDSIHVLVAIAFLDHVPYGNKVVVDHINGIKTDNRLQNLRLISNRENVYAHHNGSSKYPGVSWSKKSKKWKSQIRIDRKLYYLGTFKTELEASNAYQEKLKKIK